MFKLLDEFVRSGRRVAGKPKTLGLTVLEDLGRGLPCKRNGLTILRKHLFYGGASGFCETEEKRASHDFRCVLNGS